MTGRAALATLLIALATPAPAADAPAAGAAKPAAAAAPAPQPSASATDPLDYTMLTHHVFLDSLRSGSYDDTGHNDYFFTATMYGLLNSAEERNLEFAKRKKVTDDVGKFGATKIDSLAVWRPDEKAKDFKELKVDGNAIRELAAKAMTQFGAKEDDIAIEVEIVMMKKNKKFVFFGDEQPVASTTYFPIPATKFDTPIRTNQTLVIADDKGTLVKISVRYDKPATAAKAAPPPAADAVKKP